MPTTIKQQLQNLTGAFAQDIVNLAKDDVLSPVEWPLAQRIEQPECCDACRAIDGKIIAKSDASYKKFLRQLHMNCRGYWVDIHRDEGHEDAGPDGQAVWVGTQPDWPALPKELLDKYAHFIQEPKKYAALNVPALPGGRTFIFSPGAPGQPGKFTFAPALPPRLLLSTVAQISRRTVGLALANSELLPAAIGTLRQCAAQVAERALVAPDTFVRDLAHDYLEYSSGLSHEIFSRLPADLLADPQLAVARGRITAGTGSHPALFFRGRAGGEDTAVALDLRTGQLAYVNAPSDLLTQLPDFQPLKGTW